MTGRYGNVDANFGFTGAIPPGVTIESNVADLIAYRQTHTIQQTFDYWFDNVDYGGKWDFKSKPGGDPLYNDFGNYHYAILASALGVPDYFARLGAGWAQQKRDGFGTTNTPNNTVLSFFYAVIDGSYHGDHPEDQVVIQKALDAANKTTVYGAAAYSGSAQLLWGPLPKDSNPVVLQANGSGESKSFQISDETGGIRVTSNSGLTMVQRLNKNLEATEQYQVYKVQIGDTITAIEDKFGMPRGSLAKINSATIGGNPNLIYAGEQLYVSPQILDGNQSAAPSLTVGADQFFVDGVFSDASLIGFATGFTSDAIKAANPGVNFELPLVFGTVLNLPVTTNTFSLSTDASARARGADIPDATASISANNSTLGSTGDYTFASLLGNVNTSSGLQAVANDLIADDLRPGNFSLTLGLPTDTFLFNQTASSFVDKGLTGAMFNALSRNIESWIPTDPLVLDLNGDGVKLTNFTDAPVLFDADNDGGSKEQTGWVSAQDGIVVHDINGDGLINNIAETLSEYYKGAAGSNGMAGTKPYANGFAALKSLDTGNGTAGSAGYGDGVFDSKDAAWANLRVWVDANHDGKSWLDANDNGLKEATETTTELKTFADLGITQINLSSTTQSGEVRDGNEVLARGTFVQNGISNKEAVAANFLNNPAGSTLTQTSSGVTATLEGGTGTKSYASSNANSGTGEALSAATLGVQNVTGGAGDDTLTGDAQANWLAGGLGADVFNAGAGDDIILADAKDLANAAAINGGDGLDMVQVIGSEGVSLNMAASKVEIAVGNIGNDVIIGGGGTSVFVRGGDGDDVIVGSAANDALSGENGDDYIDGGAGNDIIRGHRGRDQLSGGSGDDLIEGGLEDDRLSGGLGNDVLKGGSGDDLIAGGDGIDVAEYGGSYADYRVTQLNDSTWRVVDTKSGCDGADILTDVEQLSFADIGHFDLNEPTALPVADVLTVNATGQSFNRTGVQTISSQQLLANDRGWNGLSLSVVSVTSNSSGTAALKSNGDIEFTPNANYQGVMSFSYTVKGNVDGADVITAAIDAATGEEATMRASVTLLTNDLPIDTNFSKQRYLSEANIIPVWKDYTGKGVRIAQFEPGGNYAVNKEVFDYRNPDLQPNIDYAWMNAAADANELSQDFSNHATEVAGVMVATRNGLGIVGVAYDAKLAGYNLPNGVSRFPENPDDAVDLPGFGVLAKMPAFDVVNASYSTYGLSSLLTLTGNPDPHEEAAKTGRNGNGTVMVYAAGNDRAVGGNTNISNLTQQRWVVTVGSVNAQNDLGQLINGQKPFSNPGASILVSAPGSAITTTSRTLINNNGSQFGGATATVAGTSVAAPIVSGVVALMLEANPFLGYRDVQEILALSSKQVGTTSDSDWTYNGSKTWNGGGMHASHDYGFGQVDALAAVRLAETWVSGSETYANEGKLSTTVNSPATLADGTGYTERSFTVLGNLSVEHAELKILLNAQQLSDLIIELYSPSGTKSVLMNRPGYGTNGVISDVGLVQVSNGNWELTSTHDWGEDAAGTWKVRVYDAAAGSTSSIGSMTLNLYGENGTIDDQYVFTNEYSSFATGTRDNIVDSDGGYNSINAAAVTAAQSINLTSGATSQIAGRSVKLTGTFQAAFGGDGNDIIVGNTTSNDLTGGRGDDSITAGAGDDFITGGAGNDTLTGDAGSDFFFIEKAAGSADVINDFQWDTGWEKVALIGFNSIEDFTNLTLSQKADGVEVGLGDGQTILLKGRTTAQITEQNFVFIKNSGAMAGFRSLLAGNPLAVGTEAVQQLLITGGSYFARGGNDAIGDRDTKNIVIDMGNGDDVTYGDYDGTNAATDWIVGGSGKDTLNGDGARDVVDGGSGDDKLSGGADNDELLGATGNDIIWGDEGDDTIKGGTGTDFLHGEEGKDWVYLDGDVAQVTVADQMRMGARFGGIDSDTFVLSDRAVATSLLPTATTDTITASNLIADFAVGTSGDKLDFSQRPDIRSMGDLSITSMTLLGVPLTIIQAANATSLPFVITLYNVNKSALLDSQFTFAGYAAWTIGSAAGDSLTGDAKPNFIDGGAGADTLSGRTGDDTYFVDNQGDVVEELSDGGFDIVNAVVSYTLATNIETLILAGTSNIDGTGNAERNRIVGNGGNNRLDGGAEADDLYGGGGNDTYVVNTQLDTVNEGLDQGIDTVESSVSWSLFENVENVTLTGVATINATGNALNNVLKGNSGDNILDGADGVDVMEGGLGNDTYYIDNARDVVTEAADAGVDSVYVNSNYATDPNIENAALYGDVAANLTGNALNNSLVGNKANNVLKGLAGDDTLDGGVGADIMEGGADNDTYVMDNADDVVTELADGGMDTVIVDGLPIYTLGVQIENGILVKAGSLTGNDVANVLYGSSGADSLNGGVGADTMVGGADNDTYIVDNSNDVVVEKAEADIYTSYDTIQSSASYTVPDYVEAITLTGTADINATANNIGCELNGNVGKNYLKGGDGLDFIFGDDGVDTLEGGAGDDYYYLTDNTDTVIEQAGGGLDQIWAYGDGIKMADNVERLYMQSYLARTAYGNEGNNLMAGNNRANTLYGNGGNDKLFGYSGNDTIYGGLGNDSLYGSLGNDTYHFQRGDGADTIYDSDATVGNQDQLLLDGAISADQVWLAKSGHDLVVSVIGTTDKVTINSWYLGGLYQVESIVAGGNGKTLSAANVQNLVNAMASFTPPAVGQTTLPANYNAALGNVIASNWA